MFEENIHRLARLGETEYIKKYSAIFKSYIKINIGFWYSPNSDEIQCDYCYRRFSIKHNLTLGEIKPTSKKLKLELLLNSKHEESCLVSIALNALSDLKEIDETFFDED